MPTMNMPHSPLLSMAVIPLTLFASHGQGDLATLIFLNEVEEEAAIFCLPFAPCLVHAGGQQHPHCLIARGTAACAQEPSSKGLAFHTFPTDTQEGSNGKFLLVLCSPLTGSSLLSHIPLYFT